MLLNLVYNLLLLIMMYTMNLERLSKIDNNDVLAMINFMNVID